MDWNVYTYAYICVVCRGVHACVSVYKYVCVYMCMHVYGVCTYVHMFLCVLVLTEPLLKLHKEKGPEPVILHSSPEAC